MSTDWKPGDRIQDRWEVHKILRGGMGIVYVVYDHQVHEAWAAKTFRKELLAPSPEIAGRFRQECLCWIGLDIHPNIVHAAFVETIEQRPFLFLDYVTGGDLSKWIGTPRLLDNPAEVLRLGIEFCNGMIHAHSKGIKIHRDIKPQNCLLTASGTLQVTDFGLAKAFVSGGASADAGPESAVGTKGFWTPSTPGTPQEQSLSRLGLGLTQTGMGAGTPAYMAPEQFEDLKNVDVRADIYSFGIMLYQMVTGRLPFLAANVIELERLHKTQAVPMVPISQPRLNDVIQRCVAKNHCDRFSNFTEVRDQLTVVLYGLNAQAMVRTDSVPELNIVQQANKAVSLQRLGRHREAIACFDRLLILEPDGRALTWACKGESLAALGLHSEAISCFDRALWLRADPGFWVWKGDSLFELGRVSEAVSAFDKAIEMDPRHESGWTSKGVLFDKLGRYEEALACHEQAVALDGRNPRPWHNKALVLCKLHRFEESIACSERAIETSAGFAEGWFIKGAALVNGFQKLQEAAVCFEKAAELGFTPAIAALKAIDMANKQRRAGNLREDPIVPPSSATIQIATDNLNDQPAKPAENDAAQISAEKGMAFAKEGKHDQAIACFDEAHRLGHPWAGKIAVELRVFQKVIALGQAGERDRALACLDEAQRGSTPISPNAVAQLRGFLDQCQEGTFAVPRDKIGWNDMGATLLDEGKLSEATFCFKKAIDLDPEYESPWLNMGLAFARFKEYDSALTVFERFLGIKPHSEQGWNLKGMVLGTLQRHEEAIGCYDRALQVNPRLVAAWCNKSSALMWLKRHEEAFHCCERALELQPHHLDALFAKAKALLALGRQNEAVGCARQIQLIDPARAEQLFGNTL